MSDSPDSPPLAGGLPVAGGSSTPFRIRRAEMAEAATMLDVNARAIRISAAGLYTPEQIEAWAGSLTLEQRRLTVADTIAFVALANRQVVGFSNLEVDSTEIDLLFVDPAFGGQGAARALVAAVESAATDRQIHELHTHASLRAEPVFLRLGFRVVERERHSAHGQVFARAHMAKTLR